MLLTPDCSDPLYRRAIRVSMGTVFQIPWTFLREEESGVWPDEGMRYLKELGFKDTQVYTTMELRMKCGIGKCGRCNIGSKYVCKDGPVFRCDEIDEMPNEY